MLRRPLQIWAPQVADLLDALAPIAYIAGGAARQIVIPNDAPPAEDIDVFAYEATDFDRCCEILRRNGYADVGSTDNATMFNAPNLGVDLPVQLIRPLTDGYMLTYGAPSDVIDHFSFTTEQFAIEAGGHATIGERAETDTAARLLRLNHITDPVMVALRVAKYAAKGYECPATLMLDLFDEWPKRPQCWRDVVKGKINANRR